MITMHIATTEATGASFGRRKKSRRTRFDGEATSSQPEAVRLESEHDAIMFPQVKQLIDLAAWHIGGMDAKWYVKPRSTCWFEEYLFNIYTPDMFFDILRMRRRVFDRLVQDLRPFIQGQHTHWRAPIGVEKKNCGNTIQANARSIYSIGSRQGCTGEIYCT
jgi:hypothetical protein